ncbi:TetR/AcrR family transcriptional regulator [Nocardioides sp.]|uniref:TetR/AcrR family transcriptional regulator n=1 Tax=Nocardioides sp. TaxID=35761 RepID=UPI0031FE9493|nr:TetR family transcriptional regulator [Nocardioides sp.]
MTRMSDDRLGELYAGTLRLVADLGFDNVTMDQIAEATKSSKATLYRQWGSKLALFVESLANGAPVPEVAPDTGSLRGDLREMFARREKDIEQPPELVGATLQAMKQNAELAEAVRARIIGPVNDRIDLFVRRAIDRGEVASDCPAIPYIHLVLLAPYVLNEGLTGLEYDPDFVLAYIDGLVLPALGIH